MKSVRFTHILSLPLLALIWVVSTVFALFVRATLGIHTQVSPAPVAERQAPLPAASPAQASIHIRRLAAPELVRAE